MWPLKDNYASLVEFCPFGRCCKDAPQFDDAINASADNAIGLLAAMALGARFLVVLFVLPVSCVRTVWFMNLPAEGAGHDAQPRLAVRSSSDIAMGGHCRTCEMAIHDAYHLVLRHLLFLMVFMMPLLTSFPLLFFNQLAEDRTVLSLHLCIWVYPSVLLFVCHEYCHKIWFYPAWAIGYAMLFGYFVHREMSIYNISISTLEKYWDIPYILSSMHFEFCTSSVILSDALYACLLGDPDDRKIANRNCCC
eukprot:UN4238